MIIRSVTMNISKTSSIFLRDNDSIANYDHKSSININNIKSKRSRSNNIINSFRSWMFMVNLMASSVFAVIESVQSDSSGGLYELTEDILGSSIANDGSSSSSSGSSSSSSSNNNMNTEISAEDGGGVNNSEENFTSYFPSVIMSSSSSSSSSLSSSTTDGLDNLLLNNFVNISNSAPELIEYYELVDDVSVSEPSSFTPSAVSSSSSNLKLSTIFPPSDIIYPDPEEINRKIKLLNKNYLTHKQQQETSLSSMISIPTTNYNKELEARDSDFKGHDLIDNIMYIYYGSNNTLKNSFGSSIIIGGCVLAFAAQILCVVLMILRNRTIRKQNAMFYIFLNFAIILLISNLIFIIGVQSTKNEFRCGMVAILLHYSHLCTAIWGLIGIYIIYDYIVNECGINLKYNYFMAYGVPAVYVLFSCAISSTSYEIIQYCWMSVQRGMIINFMIPVSGIIISSTILGTLCLREIATKHREVIAESIENILENAAKCHEINSSESVIETDKCCEWDDKLDDYTMTSKKSDIYDSKFDLGVLSIVDLSLRSSNDAQDYSDFKRSIKFLLFFQPTFAICWFFGVIALENRESCIMPIVFVLCYNIMNWYFLIRSPYICPIIQDQHQTEKSSTILGNNEEMNHHTSCTDTIPLLCTPTNLQHQNHQKAATAIIVEDCMNEVQLNLSTWTDSIGDISCNIDSISTISS